MVYPGAMLERSQLLRGLAVSSSSMRYNDFRIYFLCCASLHHQSLTRLPAVY